MKTKIIIFLELIRGSFWFIPALMICATVVVSFCMVTLDRGLDLETLRFSGTLIGALPGIGPINGIAILLPIAYSLGLPPESALILLAGIYNGAEYGGRISPNNAPKRTLRFAARCLA